MKESLPSSNVCESCGKGLDPGVTKYIITISSFADVDTELPPAELTESRKSELLNEIDTMSEEELTKSVYDKSIHVLCTTCRNKFTENPFG